MKLFSENTVIWRVYVIAALVAAGILAPLIYAPLPWIMLLAYIHLVLHPRDEARFGIPSSLLLALSLPLFFAPVFGGWLSPLFALPVLPLLDNSLRKFASGYVGERNEESTPGRRRLTGLAGSLAISLTAVSLVAVILSSRVLLLSAVVVAAYLGGVAGLVLLKERRRVSGNPVEAEVSRQRVVAGNLVHTPMRLVVPTKGRSRSGGYLYLYSPYSWFSIRPGRVVLNGPVINLEASFTPPLAGPSRVALAATYIDSWGLTRFDFNLEVMELLVIPRARYAEWMARRFLETSRGGGQETVTAIATSIQSRASRQGLEFYGLRAYQPGDSLRAIEWKHTSKLHQITVKEFLDTSVECALLAVNLSVTNEEEKDKLVFDLITRALTLARENIPTALAAYSHREVIKTTRLLDPQQALIASLSLTREVIISLSPRRYLATPDVGRLRTNLYRLKESGHGPANRLAELLQLEFAALGEEARQNPATEALNTALAGVKGKVNIIVVSARNHDAAALAFNRHALEAKGYRFIEGVK